MRFGKIALAAAAIVAATGPIAGQAIAIERVSAPAADESSLGNSPYGILIVLALIGLAIGLAAGGGDEPASP